MLNNPWRERNKPPARSVIHAPLRRSSMSPPRYPGSKLMFPFWDAREETRPVRKIPDLSTMPICQIWRLLNCKQWVIILFTRLFVINDATLPISSSGLTNASYTIIGLLLQLGRDERYVFIVNGSGLRHKLAGSLKIIRVYFRACSNSVWKKSALPPKIYFACIT